MDIKSLDSLKKIVYDTQVIRKADVLELVDETDSKSVASNGVWVRVPPSAPLLFIFCEWLRNSGIYSGFRKSMEKYFARKSDVLRKISGF